MLAHEVGELTGGDLRAAERAQVISRGLGAGNEAAFGGIEQLGAAPHLDEAEKVIVPRLHAAARGQRPYAYLALLDTVALPDIAVAGAVGGRALLRVFTHSLMQPGLVGLELAQQVSPAGGDGLNRFFEDAARPA